MTTTHSGNKGPSVVYWLDKKLYLNITNQCTNDCYFCIRKFKTGIAEFNLKLEKEPSSNEVIRELQKIPIGGLWDEVVFCGFGEPTTRLEVLLEIAWWIRKHFSTPIRLDTNGQSFLLYPERDVVRELKEAGVEKVSVSLNAHDKVTYNEVCQPKFETAFENILEFVERARDANLDVEVTVVSVPEIKMSKVEMRASDLGVGFRIRPYHSCIW